jgi:CcmD family protein
MNFYLLAAFGLLWVLFFAYAWNLSRRQEALRAELEALQQTLESHPAAPPDSC